MLVIILSNATDAPKQICLAEFDLCLFLVFIHFFSKIESLFKNKF